MAETKRALRPTNDLLFKRCIGNAEHPDITRGFISDILGIKVESVLIQNPYDIVLYQKEVDERKLGVTVVDVLVRLADQSQVAIEMQIASQDYFLERALFYASRHYTNDYGVDGLKRKARGSDVKYSSLCPVYSINILDFLQFDSDADPLHAFSLYDMQHASFYGTGKAAPGIGGLLSLVFLELGKPKENASERIGCLMDFFNGKPLPDEAPSYLSEALLLVDEQNLTKEEIEMIDAAERAEEDRKGQIAYARKQGRKDVALAALREGASPEFIAHITGFDLEMIMRFKTELEK